MNILVTGGCGFIGSNFIKHMLDTYDYKITNIDKLTYAGRRENLEDDGVPIQKDDSAVVLRPNFRHDGTWDNTVHVNAVMMPTEKLEKADADYLTEVTYALVACFNLMNTDPEFAYKVGEELSKMNIDEGFSQDTTKSNVIQLSQWTKTEGNA